MILGRCTSRFLRISTLEETNPNHRRPRLRIVEVESRSSFDIFPFASLFRGWYA